MPIYRGAEVDMVSWRRPIVLWIEVMIVDRNAAPLREKLGALDADEGRMAFPKVH
jgi:hypothetical protein